MADPGVPSKNDVERHVSDAVSAFATLANGKWEPKKDPLAVVKLLGSLAGLVSAAMLTAQAFGLV